MKFLLHKLLAPIALLACSSVWADIALQDASQILGAWTLESVAPGLDKPKIPENRIWEFKPDGTIHTSGYNRHIKSNDEYTLSYRIENGRILVEIPGRVGKYIDYSVYEMTDSGMILKGGIEGFYFFTRK